jgi:hypothetical protein
LEYRGSDPSRLGGSLEGLILKTSEGLMLKTGITPYNAAQGVDVCDFCFSVSATRSTVPQAHLTKKR